MKWAKPDAFTAMMLVGGGLLGGGLGRGAAVAFGHPGVSGWWWAAAVTGLLLMSNACSYQYGRLAGISHMAERQAEEWEPLRAALAGSRSGSSTFLASRSPGAGRPGASLTGVVGSPHQAQPGGRVGTEPTPLAGVMLCVTPASPAEAGDLFEVGRARCRCGHYAGELRGPGWERDPGLYRADDGWLCPCCTGPRP